MPSFVRAITLSLCWCLLTTGAEHDSLLIWDNAGAGEAWDRGYPVGNGRMGAMASGNFPRERILINEETIWQRGDPLVMPSDSFAKLETIRQLEAVGNYAEADKLFEDTIQKGGVDPCGYQLFGWLEIEYVGTAPLSKCYRELNLNNAVARNIYQLEGGASITQELFACKQEGVIALRIRSDVKNSVRLRLEGAKVEKNQLVKEGQADGQSATRFLGIVRVSPAERVTAHEEYLEVSGGSDITVLVAVATDLDRQHAGRKLADGWQVQPSRILDHLHGCPIDAIMEKAVAEHQRYFNRVAVDFGRSPAELCALPTRERLQRFQQGCRDDPDLVETYFQFGRYLLISSSRPGSFPANLQGIWNPHSKAPWGADYHLNINLQMNYWLAETTNLSEMHQPLLEFIRYCLPAGRGMARRMGMRGWCMGHSTDIWANARIMSRRAFWGGSFFGGQWLTMHILEHYRFTRDKRALESYWEVLSDSAAFVESWLIEDHATKMLLARPAASPENSFLYSSPDGTKNKASLSAGNTFDQFMVLQVFNDYIEAAEALDRADTPLVQRIRKLLPCVYRPGVAEDGRLMEWRLPFEEAEPGHRHVSHVLGAFPGNQIDLDSDTTLRDAVQRSLESRLSHGGAKTGWSRAWTIGIFARLGDAAQAYDNLCAILEQSTLPNLWDNHPPFQIDGNFGATASITEMLLQSHGGSIKLLPALPAQWDEGYFTGLRARGDYTVSASWQGGILKEAVIQAGPQARERITLVHRDQRRELSLGPGQQVRLSGEL